MDACLNCGMKNRCEISKSRHITQLLQHKGTNSEKTDIVGAIIFVQKLCRGATKIWFKRGCRPDSCQTYLYQIFFHFLLQFEPAGSFMQSQRSSFGCGTVEWAFIRTFASIILLASRTHRTSSKQLKKYNQRCFPYHAALLCID